MSGICGYSACVRPDVIMTLCILDEKLLARFSLAGAFAAVLVLAPHFAHAQGAPEMVPFALDHRRAMESHSPVDVSFLLDAPAGKHGFIQVLNGHLSTSEGRRIRLWGVNITDWSKGSRQIPTDRKSVV